MKKIAILLAAVALTGCASTAYHNAKSGILMDDVNSINMPSLKADVEVGEKISGVAECESWFGIITKSPNRQTYGVELQKETGNMTPADCTRGALYEAMSKSNADVIISPKYTSVKKDNWCIFGYCIHKVRQIIVTGYKGNIKNISQMQKPDFELYGLPKSSQKKNVAIELDLTKHTAQ